MTPISSLPPAVQDKVKKYQEKHNRLFYGEDNLESIFWRNTDEGYEFWLCVDNGGWQSACEAFPEIAATFEQATAPWQPQRGEMVEGRDKGITWLQCQYITYEPSVKSGQQHIVKIKDSVTTFEEIRPLPAAITLSQIAEKFGIPEDQVRIEGFTKNQKW